MNDKTYKSKYEGYFFTDQRHAILLKTTGYYSVGMKSNSRQNFKFKKETYLDKFSKLIGFSKEFQVRDPNFDKKIYIVSDCELFCQDLYQSKKLQDLIMELFNQGIRTIESDANRLFTTFESYPKEYKDKYWENSNFEPLEQFKGKILEVLAEINQILNGLSSSYEPIDPLLSKWPKVRLFLGLALFAAFINLAFDPYIDRLIYEGLFADSLHYSIPIFLVCLITSVAMFFRTSRAHIIVANNIKWVLLPIVIWTYFTMSYINVYFDDYQPETSYSEVIKKEKHHRIKGGTTYKVIVNHFEQPGKTFTLASSKHLYNLVDVGSEVIFTVRSGYLGYRWVEKEENLVVHFMKDINMEDAVKGIKPSTIPANWLGRKLKNDNGYTWYDPKNQGDAIFIYKENKPIPEKSRTYAHIFKDGIAIDKFGKKIPGSSMPDD